MKKFKVLLVYPNLMLVSLLPNNIASLSASLKKEGFDVRVFDTTLYKTTDKTNDEMRVERMQVRKFNIEDAGIKIKQSDMYEDFAREVKDYQPDLIGVTVLDDTVEMGLDLIKRADCGNIPVILGGVHATLNPEELIKKDEVDIICVGEGEEALVELCHCLKNKQPYDNIKNLWVKSKDGTVIRNELRPPVDVNTLPFEDYSVFEKQRIYRPMQGKMLAIMPINFDRGCPFRCTFCDAPALSDSYKNAGFHYYRHKSIERIHQEMKYQTSLFPISYFYFNSETFLSMSMPVLKDFARMYSEFGLPFWCQTRIETINEEKIKILKEMNCDRISVGIEHGNEEFREKMLNKKFTNKEVIEAFQILNKYDMKISVNNVIGFPDETRELVFDTINLNRQIKADSVNGFIFQPYCGTYLREYSIEKGYLSEDSTEIDNPIGNSVLDMPQLPREEIEGLLRTFVLYVKMPKSYFPKIKMAEQLTEEGDKTLAELREIFFSKYFK
jgi:radical SAM superfamily enzyme YgiQ (UPF0313 family)